MSEPTVDTKSGRSAAVPCLTCNHNTRHQICASVRRSENHVGDGLDVTHYFEYEILRCMGCDSFTFRQIESNTEDMDYSDDGIPEPFERTTYFPQRASGRVSLKDVELLPDQVSAIYRETIAALNGYQPILAGIGLRALVEMICVNKSAKGANLAAKIDSLVTLGVLTSDGAKILHRIRTLGNGAAHEAKPHDARALSIALDVVEHLLRGTYVLPIHAEEMPRVKC